MKSRIEMLEKKLSKTCQEIYEISMCGRHFIPRHPYVLVRVLPKEHRTEGGIYLPEQSQNKPVYEGIVLDVWRPYDEHRTKWLTDTDSAIGHGICEHIMIHHECSLKVGQRIAFPHYEGIALGEWLDDRYYKLVREGTDQNNWPYCNVLGILDYTGDVEIQAKIRKLTAQLSSVTFSGVSLSRGADPQESAR